MYTEYNSEQVYSNPSNFQNEQKSNKFFSVMWKILLVIIVLVLAFLLLIKFEVISLTSSIMPEAILLNQNEIGVKKGKSYQLVSTILPEKASNKKVIWSSSDPSIVEVNEVTGYITALKEGSAIVTVKTLVNDISTDCLVNVTGKNISPTSININEKYINIGVGYTHSLTYRVLPSNATEIGLKFTSSDPSIAIVNSKGVVKGVKEGNAIITVSSNNGTVRDTAYVTIYKEGSSTIIDGESIKIDNYPKSLSLNYTSLNLKLGASAQVVATILPDNASKKLSWSSSNSRIVTVDSNGLIQAKGIGTAIIVAKTVNDIIAQVKVTVGEYDLGLKSIKITTRYSTIPVGVTKQLVVAFNPANASDKTVTWTSSNPNVATINSSGQLKAISPGSTIITATSRDGGYKDTAIIEISGSGDNQEVKSISYPQSTYQVGINGTINLNPIITPSNATFKAVTFTSSNPSIASVDINGVVRGIREGETIVTTMVNRNHLKADVKIIVKNIKATSLTLNNTNVSLSLGDTFTLRANVLPTNASNKTVTFTSSNQNIAKIDNNGIITATGIGTTTIIVTPNGGGSSSTCLVTVK